MAADSAGFIPAERGEVVGLGFRDGPIGVPHVAMSDLAGAVDDVRVVSASALLGAVDGEGFDVSRPALAAEGVRPSGFGGNEYLGDYIVLAFLLADQIAVGKDSGFGDCSFGGAIVW